MGLKVQSRAAPSLWDGLHSQTSSLHPACLSILQKAPGALQTELHCSWTSPRESLLDEGGRRMSAELCSSKASCILLRVPSFFISWVISEALSRQKSCPRRSDPNPQKLEEQDIRYFQTPDAQPRHLQGGPEAVRQQVPGS